MSNQRFEVGEPGKPHIPEDVQDALRTLIFWAGDEPGREGLIDTPARVAPAWREHCRGYFEEPGAQHGWMTGRSVRTQGGGMVTSRMLGCFLDDPKSRVKILSLMGCS